MFPDFTAGVVVLALVPALLRWWHGRTLLRHVDDAALPERLLAGNRRMVFALALPAALLGVFFTDAVLWGFPIMLAGYTVAGFPLRKALYQETWSLPAYLWFLARLLTATLGFWVLLTATPLLASSAGTNDWIVGLAIGGLLLAWNARYSEVTRWLLRAEPLRDPALRERFDALAAKCGVTPAFEMIDLRGGAIANAVAVPSLRQPAAVFSDTLLRLLDADEITAICAHELAHLEYYSPSRLAHLSRINQTLVAAAVLYGPSASWCRNPCLS
jgi:Zn-dependent protease with chaperone function